MPYGQAASIVKLQPYSSLVDLYLTFSELETFDNCIYISLVLIQILLELAEIEIYLA